MRNIWKILIAIVLCFLIFWGGFYVGQKFSVLPESFLNFQSNFFTGKNLSLFWEVWNILNNNYIKKENLDQNKAFYGALEGIVKSVGDDYTEFYTPDEAKIFNEDISGKFEGVGMEITIKKGLVTVVAPLENTPAWRAGIKAGDVILKIDGQDATNLKLQEAVRRIRGPKGTKVTLTIMRDEFSEPKDFVIVRDVIRVYSVRYKNINGIGYIKINNFGSNSVLEFSNAVTSLLRDGVKGFILDLRNNPGGFLEAAVSISGWFLKRGDKVVVEDFGGKSPQRIHRSQGPSILLGYPVVVILNNGSASASEILAAALRENNNVKIIGTKSFGKGSVQQVFYLSDGSLVKVTVALWLTPKGHIIEGKGIEPDIKIEEEKEEKVIEKAIEIINSQI